MLQFLYPVVQCYLHISFVVCFCYWLAIVSFVTVFMCMLRNVTNFLPAGFAWKLVKLWLRILHCYMACQNFLSVFAAFLLLINTLLMLK